MSQMTLFIAISKIMSIDIKQLSILRVRIKWHILEGACVVNTSDRVIDLLCLYCISYDKTFDIGFMNSVADNVQTSLFCYLCQHWVQSKRHRLWFSTKKCSCYSTKTHINSVILILKLNLTSLTNIYIKMCVVLNEDHF